MLVMDDEECFWWYVNHHLRQVTRVDMLYTTPARLLIQMECHPPADGRMDILRLATIYDLCKEGYRVCDIE